MSNIHDDQRVGVFVDVQNMYYSAKNLYDTKVDFEKVLDTAVMNRKLVRASAYVVKGETPGEGNFFEALRQIGYEVKIKELKEFYGGEKKGDWDLGMTVDMIQQAKKMDTVVLVTGDGDFAVLVDHLKAMGCRVEVMSFGKSSAKELRESATNFIDMDNNSEKYLVDWRRPVRMRDVAARQVMNEDPETISNDSNIAKAKNKMEDYGLRALTVVDSKNKIKGAIGYRDLIRHVQFNPQKTGLEKVMHQPPAFDESDNLIDLAELRINSGRKMMVYTENKKIKGVIGDDEFREAFRESEAFSGLTTKDLGPTELLKVFEDDTIEQARHKMLDNNISRLPVLDNNGKLTGVVTSTDLLKVIISRQKQSAGGTSGKTLKDTKIAGGSEKESLSNITVSEIMNRTPLTLEGHSSADKALDKMSDREAREVIITSDGYPETIVTVKDYIDHASSLKQRNMVLVNLIGVETGDEKAAIHKKIENQLRGSLGRKLKQPEELNLHIKKAEKDGKKHRYEAIMKLFSEYGQTTTQSEAWDLLEVVDNCLRDINRAVRDKKERKTEH